MKNRMNSQVRCTLLSLLPQTAVFGFLLFSMKDRGNSQVRLTLLSLRTQAQNASHSPSCLSSSPSCPSSASFSSSTSSERSLGNLVTPLVLEDQATQTSDRSLPSLPKISTQNPSPPPSSPSSPLPLPPPLPPPPPPPPLPPPPSPPSSQVIHSFPVETLESSSERLCSRNLPAKTFEPCDMCCGERLQCHWMYDGERRSGVVEEKTVKKKKRRKYSDWDYEVRKKIPECSEESVMSRKTKELLRNFTNGSSCQPRKSPNHRSPTSPFHRHSKSPTRHRPTSPLSCYHPLKSPLQHPKPPIERQQVSKPPIKCQQPTKRKMVENYSGEEEGSCHQGTLQRFFKPPPMRLCKRQAVPQSREFLDPNEEFTEAEQQKFELLCREKSWKKKKRRRKCQVEASEESWNGSRGESLGEDSARWRC